MCGDKRSPHGQLARVRKKTVSSFFTSSVATLRQISEQQKTLSWILLKQNKIVGALSEIRESAQEDKKMVSKPGDKLETPVLDRGGSKRAPNSLNNGDKPKTTVFRLRRQKESTEQMLGFCLSMWGHVLLEPMRSEGS